MYITRSSSFKSLFFYQRSLMVSHRTLSDSKSLQDSRTLLSILSDLNNAAVWIVSICSLISQPSSPFINPLGIVLSALITIGITIILMFYFFSSLAISRYLSLFSLSLNFTQWFARTENFTIQQVLIFCWLSHGLVVWPKWGDPFVSKNHRVSLSLWLIYFWQVFHSSFNSNF